MPVEVVELASGGLGERRWKEGAGRGGGDQSAIIALILHVFHVNFFLANGVFVSYCLVEELRGFELGFLAEVGEDVVFGRSLELGFFGEGAGEGGGAVVSSESPQILIKK